MAKVAALKTRKLTGRQEAFIREYLVDRNATQAAVRAGYRGNYADRIGHELLEKTRVRERIEKAEKEHFRRLGISAERLLSHVWSIATYDPRSFYKEVDGKLVPKDLGELTHDQAMVVQDFRTDANGKIAGFKFADRQKAQDLAGKFYGFDKINIEARITADVDQELRIDLSGADPKDLAHLVRLSAEEDR